MGYELLEPEIISFAERYNSVLRVSRGGCPEDESVCAYYLIYEPGQRSHLLNGALSRMHKRLLRLSPHEFFAVAEWPANLSANFLGETIWERNGAEKV